MYILISSMLETWKPVLGWETLYEVSDLGSIRSLTRTITSKMGWTRVLKGRLLKPYLNKQRKIYQFLLQDGKRKRRVNIALLVLETFIGIKPDGHVVCHGKKGRLCNHLSNLSYGTMSKNMLDRWRDGTMPHGSHHANSKLNVNDVKAIRQLRDDGISCSKIAAKFGVCKDVISRIHQRKQWAWVS